MVVEIRTKCIQPPSLPQVWTRTRPQRQYLPPELQTMYTYCCLAPGEDVWPLLQPLTYTYLPAPLLLPPIQAHNFCSRHQNLSARGWAAPQEYHCFHGVSAPLTVVPPFWAFPQAYSAALQPPFLAPGYNRALRQEPEAAGLVATESWAPWPEGGTLQAELCWGRVERALGQRLELPDSESSWNSSS
nr:uncharacterized protein C10orf95 homolog [Vicugna pacos]